MGRCLAAVGSPSSPSVGASLIRSSASGVSREVDGEPQHQIDRWIDKGAIVAERTTRLREWSRECVVLVVICTMLPE